MKLQPRQIEGFIKNPDPAIRAILVYGPDDGMVRERVAALGATVVPDLNDPFNVAHMTGDTVEQDPARLSDEANAMSLMGGARLVRVDGAADALTTTLKEYLKNPNPGNLVLLNAGELSTRSSLRKLFETAPNAAAIPCYAASQGDIATLIRQSLKDAGYAIDPDAVQWLAQQLMGDRGLARMEIEKLSLYLSSQPQNTSASLQDVQLCCGQGGAYSLDDLVFATGGADPDTALRSFHQLVDEGMAVIVVHRSLQNHFRRLHLTRSRMAQGMSAHEAMNALNPKVFFKWEDSFRAQLNKWPLQRLDNVLKRLAQIEADCKKTGTPAETLTAQAILSLAAR